MIGCLSLVFPRALNRPHQAVLFPAPHTARLDRIMAWAVAGLGPRQEPFSPVVGMTVYFETVQRERTSDYFEQNVTSCEVTGR